MPEPTDEIEIRKPGGGKDVYLADEVKFDYEGDSRLLTELEFELRNPGAVSEIEDPNNLGYEELEELIGEYEEGEENRQTDQPVLYIQGLKSRNLGNIHIVIGKWEDIRDKLEPVSEE